MTTKSSRQTVIRNLEEYGVIELLHTMEQDPELHTESSYSPNTEQYPDHLIPFTDKHIKYLMAHPNTDIHHYLTNLRLQIRKR